MSNEIDDNKDASVDGGQQDDTAVLKAKVKELEAEASKHRGIRKSVEKERDEWKAKAEVSGKSDGNENYKDLWTKSEETNKALMAKVKTEAIKSAVTQHFTKAGVIADAIPVAAKLIDQNMIEWDVDNGIDDVSVRAAVAKVRSEMPFLFEKTISGVTPKEPAAGSKPGNAKEIKRSDFAGLSPKEQHARITKEGWTVIDD